MIDDKKIKKNINSNHLISLMKINTFSFINNE